jgi:hypothetical protein
MLACLVQILEIFMSKSTFWRKNRALLKKMVNVPYLFTGITQELVEISQKFQRIWIQPAKSYCSKLKNP